MYQKILVPLDGSELSEAVIEQAKMLCRCAGASAELVLMRVTQYPLYDYSAADVMLADAVATAVRNEAQQYLDQLAGAIAKEDIRVRVVVREGAVADNILDYADHNAVDLIAMSTHGRSGLGRWLIGSVADRVMHGARVPLLLVRPVQAH